MSRVQYCYEARLVAHMMCRPTSSNFRQSFLEDIHGVALICTTTEVIVLLVKESDCLFQNCKMQPLLGGGGFRHSLTIDQALNLKLTDPVQASFYSNSLELNLDSYKCKIVRNLLVSGSGFVPDSSSRTLT